MLLTGLLSILSTVLKGAVLQAVHIKQPILGTALVLSAWQLSFHSKEILFGLMLFCWSCVRWEYEASAANTLVLIESQTKRALSSLAALPHSEMVWRAWRGAWKLSPHEGVTFPIARLACFEASSVTPPLLWSGMWRFYLWMRCATFDVNEIVAKWRCLTLAQHIPRWLLEWTIQLEGAFLQGKQCAAVVWDVCYLCVPLKQHKVCRQILCQKRFDFWMCLGGGWWADKLIVWCLLVKLDLHFRQWQIWLFFCPVSSLPYISFSFLFLLQVWGFFENWNTNLKCFI